jgi:hypothetical protein
MRRLPMLGRKIAGLLEVRTLKTGTLVRTWCDPKVMQCSGYLFLWTYCTKP